MDFRISKYLLAPEKLQNESDWQSVSQIGKVFAGKRLTVNRYLAVERAYVAAALYLHGALNCAARLEEIEGNSRDWASVKRHAAEKGLDPVTTDVLPKAGHEISATAFADLLRASLREFVWARFSIGNSCEIACGYDFFLYAWGAEVSVSLVRGVQQFGLKVEERASPWN
jgi:hypothetical protein